MNTEYIIYGIIAVFLIVIIMWMMGFKEWLVYAVADAEKILGSKTGELKLRMVYDMAVTKFPIMAKILPFSIFHMLVKSALKVMNKMIAENKSIAEAITNEVMGDD